MPIVGYGRVSSRGQSLDVQLAKLREAGCDKVYAEKKSGLDGKRKELARCLDYVREGDVLLVTKLDRLARSTIDLYAILGRLREKGADFRCLDNPELDTTTKHGKLLVGILSLIAEFEVDIKKERQLDGIAMAKERGVKFGRQPTVTEEDIRQMKSRRKQGALIRELQVDYKLSKAHVYRLLAA
jgi:DNA invertase Pin-like site-specific DNA recombinase